MDGEHDGKPYLKWMIWGVPLFSETSIWCELRDSMIQQKPPSNQKQQLSTE